jgi:hypothetical protein
MGSVRGEVGTRLNIEEILASGLPPQLKTFAFYTGKSSLNRTIRGRLDELGYKELERATLAVPIASNTRLPGPTGQEYNVA